MADHSISNTSPSPKNYAEESEAVQRARKKATVSCSKSDRAMTDENIQQTIQLLRGQRATRPGTKLSDSKQCTDLTGADAQQVIQGIRQRAGI